MLQAIAKVGHDLSSQRSGHKHFTALRTGDGTATRHAATLTLTKLESPGRRNSRSCRPCGTVACPVAAALATDAGGCSSVRGGGGQIWSALGRVLELGVGGNVECAILLILQSSRPFIILWGRGLIVTAFKCLKGSDDEVASENVFFNSTLAEKYYFGFSRKLINT